eukprot:SAG11_NODE_4108_length_2048_cov_1.508915_1_plen_57_part_00
MRMRAAPHGCGGILAFGALVLWQIIEGEKWAVNRWFRERATIKGSKQWAAGKHDEL